MGTIYIRFKRTRLRRVQEIKEKETNRIIVSNWSEIYSINKDIIWYLHRTWRNQEHGSGIGPSDKNRTLDKSSWWPMWKTYCELGTSRSRP